jgi:very-short-patch-repair endonuclease
MTHRRTQPNTFSNSHELRLNQTDSEKELWQSLSSIQLCHGHFRRQHAIGPYIVDFCAPRYKLIIELDGGQHIDQQDYDNERTAYLEQKGYQVLRFWNNEIKDHCDDVLQAISRAIEDIELTLSRRWIPPLFLLQKWERVARSSLRGGRRVRVISRMGKRLS